MSRVLSAEEVSELLALDDEQLCDYIDCDVMQAVYLIRTLAALSQPATQQGEER